MKFGIFGLQSLHTGCRLRSVGGQKHLFQNDFESMCISKCITDTEENGMLSQLIIVVSIQPSVSVFINDALVEVFFF